ncbi:MAG TPA: toxin-antitoxin system YwqK family antitoxin [Pirellulales bacterium]|nr:toxin-antitoxin system YwqK family antitoxin [Pirellulales bacterium]
MMLAKMRCARRVGVALVSVFVVCFVQLIAASIAMDDHIQEHEVVSKPVAGLGRKVQLRIGDKIIGERQYYDNGNVYRESRVENGALNGAQRMWHRNGSLWQERVYKDGVMDGEVRSWDQDRQLVGTSTMRAGTGVLRNYDAGGKLQSECPYSGGKKHGVHRQWYGETGTLLGDAMYSNGVNDGWSRFYYPNGVLLEEGMFQDGKMHGVFREWNDNGVIKAEFPKYYVHGEEVSKSQLEKLAASDVDIRRSLKVQASE